MARGRTKTVAAGVALALAGCDGPAGAPVRFDGVTSANVSTFTMSPGRCVASVIFDDFRVGWVPGEVAKAGRPTKVHKRGLVFAIPPSARGRTVSIDLRGGYLTAGPVEAVSGKLTASGRTFALKLPGEGGDSEIYQRFTVEIPKDADSVPIAVETSAAQPKEGRSSMLLDVDSLDIALAGC